MYFIHFLYAVGIYVHFVSCPYPALNYYEKTSDYKYWILTGICVGKQYNIPLAT